MPADPAFAADDWNVLKEFPFKVVLAATAADVKGPVGAAAKEMVVGARALVSSATENYAENSLIMGVLADVADDQVEEDEISLSNPQARQAAIVEVLALGHQVAAILETQADPDVASQYKEWVVGAAIAVTEATKSGGFLGIGSTLVSEEEEFFIDQLRLALTPAVEG